MATGARIAEEYNSRQSAAAKARALYFLSLRDMGLSEAAIAQEHGISRQRVNQLLKRAREYRDADSPSSNSS